MYLKRYLPRDWLPPLFFYHTTKIVQSWIIYGGKSYETSFFKVTAYTIPHPIDSGICLTKNFEIESNQSSAHSSIVVLLAQSWNL